MLIMLFAATATSNDVSDLFNDNEGPVPVVLAVEFAFRFMNGYGENSAMSMTGVSIVTVAGFLGPWYALE